jgi:type 1 glutamine amidotransferase
MAAGLLVTALGGGLLAAKSGGVSDDVIKKIEEACPASATVKPAAPRKVLVYSKCFGFYHGSIPTGAKAIEVLGRKTGAYEAVLTDDPAMLAPEKLKDFDAIVLNNTTGHFKTPEDKAVVGHVKAFVEAGKGAVGIHAATDGQFGEIFSAFFSGHPWHEDVGIKIDDPNHPLNAAFGGENFVIKDEIYQFNKGAYSREKLRVLLTLDMSKTKPKGKRPDNDYGVSWCRTLGQGRVFYCSLGHRNEIFWNPKVLRHYLDGIQFALGDLKADTTPSAKAGQ